MPQIDLTTILAAVFGGSGVAGWIMVYVQMRNETKKQGLEYFRQIVLTPDFIHYLGLTFSLLSAFSEVPQTKEDIESVRNDVAELNKFKSMIGGSIFFLPYKVLDALNEADLSVVKMVEFLLAGNPTAIPDAHRHASSCVTRLGLELKKVLGIDIKTS